MAETPLKIGIVMDPIQSITPYKDSSLAMLLEAERRNAEIHYFEQKDLSLVSGKALGQSTLLHVRDDNDDWFELGDQGTSGAGRPRRNPDAQGSARSTWSTSTRRTFSIAPQDEGPCRQCAAGAS